MYTTCSTAAVSTVVVVAVLLEKTGNNPKQRTQINKSIFFIIILCSLFYNSSRIAYDGCSVRNVFDDNCTSTDSTPFTDFYSLNYRSPNTDMRTFFYNNVSG